jgi:hypothetical protein
MKFQATPQLILFIRAIGLAYETTQSWEVVQAMVACGNTEADAVLYHTGAEDALNYVEVAHQHCADLAELGGLAIDVGAANAFARALEDGIDCVVEGLGYDTSQCDARDLSWHEWLSEAIFQQAYYHEAMFHAPFVGHLYDDVVAIMRGRGWALP